LLFSPIRPHETRINARLLDVICKWFCGYNTGYEL
jgi:hypothetical protein